MCPMRFNKYPLDEHTCKFTVGSSNYDDTRNLSLNYLNSSVQVFVDAVFWGLWESFTYQNPYTKIRCF